MRQTTPNESLRDPPNRRPYCQAPCCSARASHVHTVALATPGGEERVKVDVCATHHECLHLGYLTVRCDAPGELRWFRDGEPFPESALWHTAGGDQTSTVR